MGSVAGAPGLDPALSSRLLRSPDPPITPRDAPASTGGGNKAEPCCAEATDAAAPAQSAGDSVTPPTPLRGLTMATRSGCAAPRDLPRDGTRRPALRYLHRVSLPASEEMNLRFTVLASICDAGWRMPRCRSCPLGGLNPRTHRPLPPSPRSWRAALSWQHPGCRHRDAARGQPASLGPFRSPLGATPGFGPLPQGTG